MFEQSYYGGYPSGYPQYYPYGINPPQTLSYEQCAQYGVNPESMYSPFVQPPVQAPTPGYVPGGQMVNPNLQQNSQIQSGSSNPYNGYQNMGGAGNSAKQQYTVGPAVGNKQYWWYPGMPEQNNQPQQQGSVNPAFDFMASQGYQPQQNTYYPQQQMTQPQQPNTGYMFNMQHMQTMPYYWCNQQLIALDDFVTSELYGTTYSNVDPFECIRDSIMTDEEKARRREMQQQQYYNSFYGNLYAQNQVKAEEYNKAKEVYLNFFTKLTMAAYNYTGDTITEEEIRERYCPTPVQQTFRPPTPEERELQEEFNRVQLGFSIPSICERYDQLQAIADNKRMQAYGRIKEAHDKLLGLEPGKEMTLNEYLDNAGILYADSLLADQRRKNKDATRKYSQAAFTQRLNMETGQNLPISSPDDDYLPLEERIKRRYTQQKNVFRMEDDGSITPLVPPPSPNDPYTDQKQRFMRSLTDGMKL